MILSPDCTTSLQIAVGAASVPFVSTMAAGSFWIFVSSTACWIKQGAGTPVATAGALSMYVPANTIIVIDGKAGANLAVIQDAAGGKASLTRALTF